MNTLALIFVVFITLLIATLYASRQSKDGLTFWLGFLTGCAMLAMFTMPSRVC